MERQIQTTSRAIQEIQSPAFRRLQIFVLFQGVHPTAKALRSAARFVEGLGGEILVAVPQIVPYPLPLESPDVTSETLLNQVSAAVSESGIKCEIHKVMIAQVRTEQDSWPVLLPSHCIVFLGRASGGLIHRFRNWLTARSLAKLGHEVLVA